jgi:hypothetical protein
MILSVYSNGDTTGEGPYSFVVVSATVEQADEVAKKRLRPDWVYDVERIEFQDDFVEDEPIVVVARSYYTTEMWIENNAEKNSHQELPET